MHAGEMAVGVMSFILARYRTTRPVCQILPRILDGLLTFHRAERKKIPGHNPDRDEPRVVVVNPWEMVPEKARDYQAMMEEIAVAYGEAAKSSLGDRKRSPDVLLPNSFVSAYFYLF